MELRVLPASQCQGYEQEIAGLQQELKVRQASFDEAPCFQSEYPSLIPLSWVQKASEASLASRPGFKCVPCDTHCLVVIVGKWPC